MRGFIILIKLSTPLKPLYLLFKDGLYEDLWGLKHKMLNAFISTNGIMFSYVYNKLYLYD